MSARTSGEFAEALTTCKGLAWIGQQGALVVLELVPPVSAGLEALARLRQASPETPVIVVSALDDGKYVRAAFDAGAAGYIRKGAPPYLLSTAMRLLAARERHMPQAPRRRARNPRARQSVRMSGSGTSAPHLTGRQVQVLQLAAKGFANKDIARELELSENTIKVHLRTAYATLGVCSRTQALLAASRQGVKF